MQGWRNAQSNQPNLQTLPQEHSGFVSRPFDVILDDGDLLFSSLGRERVDQGSDCEGRINKAVLRNSEGKGGKTY